MVRSSVFQTIRFDDSITEYGHEDTLFGVELERREANIRHIDNPMRQGGIETNEEFIGKTRAALRNLVLMEDDMRSHSLLLRLYDILHRMRVDGCIAHWFARKEDWLKVRLMEPTPHLRLFFIYKLGYYCSLKQK